MTSTPADDKHLPPLTSSGGGARFNTVKRARASNLAKARVSLTTAGQKKKPGPKKSKKWGKDQVKGKKPRVTVDSSTMTLDSLRSLSMKYSIDLAERSRIMDLERLSMSCVGFFSQRLIGLKNSIEVG